MLSSAQEPGGVFRQPGRANPQRLRLEREEGLGCQREILVAAGIAEHITSRRCGPHDRACELMRCAGCTWRNDVGDCTLVPQHFPHIERPPAGKILHAQDSVRDGSSLGGNGGNDNAIRRTCHAYQRVAFRCNGTAKCGINFLEDKRTGRKRQSAGRGSYLFGRSLRCEITAVCAHDQDVALICRRASERHAGEEPNARKPHSGIAGSTQIVGDQHTGGRGMAIRVVNRRHMCPVAKGCKVKLPLARTERETRRSESPPMLPGAVRPQWQPRKR